MSIVAIVLAAGSARRFGGDKRRAKINGQYTMLSQTLSLALNQAKSVWVTFKPEDDIKELLGDFFSHPKLHPIFVDDAQLGMGHSLAAGANAIVATNDTALTGVLVFLADMPFIQPSTVEKIIAHSHHDRITVPVFEKGGDKIPGHPVLFGAHWLNALSALSGDKGGRALWQNSDQIIKIDVDDEGVLMDVDKPEQLNLQT